MRIGIYDPYLDALSGGEKYMLTAASCLSQKHDVFVFWDSESIFTPAQKKFDIDLSKVKMTKNIFSQNVSLLERLQKSKKYDIIFYLSDGSIPIVLSKKLFLHFQFPVEWVQGKSWRNKCKMKRTSGIICNSQFTKKFIDKTFGITSAVIYPPCGDNRKIQNIRKKNSIVTVGRFELLGDGRTFKKQEILMHAFKKMVDDGLQGWHFTLVISFQQSDKEKLLFLEKMAENYPITIVKNASYQELSELYGSAKIYWHAAGFRENLQMHPEFAEHFGIATVQAMEQGAVPVVIDAGGQVEIIDNAKNGFLWKNEKELLEKTSELIQNSALWRHVSEEAKNKSQLFSKEEFCRKMHNTFSS